MAVAAPLRAGRPTTAGLAVHRGLRPESLLLARRASAGSLERVAARLERHRVLADAWSRDARNDQAAVADLVQQWQSEQLALLDALYAQGFQEGADNFREQHPGLAGEDDPEADGGGDFMGPHKASIGKMAAEIFNLAMGALTVKQIADWFDGNAHRIDQQAETVAWQAEQRGYREAGHGQGLEIDWELDEDAEHCNDCPDLADGSPYTDDGGDNPLPTFPGAGDTQCGPNCRCSLNYRQPPDDQGPDDGTPPGGEPSQPEDVFGPEDVAGGLGVERSAALEGESAGESMDLAGDAFRSERLEHAAGYDAEGRMVALKVGGQSEVQFNADEIRAQNRGWGVHNHPGGTSFSPSDVAFAFANRMRGIDVVAPGVTYRLRPVGSLFRPEDARKVLDAAAHESELAHDAYYLAAQKAWAEQPAGHALSFGQVWQRATVNYWHDVWKATAERTGLFRYERVGAPARNASGVSVVARGVGVKEFPALDRLPDRTEEYLRRDLHAEGEWRLPPERPGRWTKPHGGHWTPVKGWYIDKGGLHKAEWHPPRPGKRSYGGVIFDSQGRVLLREPAHHFDGYVWTWPKGTWEAGEATARTAMREVQEETGLRAKILGHVPGDFASKSDARNYFYLMRAAEVAGRPDEETWSLRWATPKDARELIGRSTNGPGRDRDLAVLNAALKAMRDTGLGLQEAAVPLAPAELGKLPASFPKTWAELSSLKPVSGPQGSNPAHWFQDAIGQRYIAKEMSAERVASEVAALRVYEAAGAKLGLDVPYARALADGGKNYFVARALPGLEPMSGQKWAGSAVARMNARKLWAVDALLSNWDVAGIDFANLPLYAGKPVRIDAGGAMKYRAQGGVKPQWSAGHPWDDPWTMRGIPHGTGVANAQLKAIFGDISDKEASELLGDLKALDLGKIADAWKAAGMSQAAITENMAVIAKRLQEIPAIQAQLGWKPVVDKPVAPPKPEHVPPPPAAASSVAWAPWDQGGDKWGKKFALAHKDWAAWWTGYSKTQEGKDFITAATLNMQHAASVAAKGETEKMWYSLRAAMGRTYNVALGHPESGLAKDFSLAGMPPKVQAFWSKELGLVEVPKTPADVAKEVAAKAKAAGHAYVDTAADKHGQAWAKEHPDWLAWWKKFANTEEGAAYIAERTADLLTTFSPAQVEKGWAKFYSTRAAMARSHNDVLLGKVVPNEKVQAFWHEQLAGPPEKVAVPPQKTVPTAMPKAESAQSFVAAHQEWYQDWYKHADLPDGEIHALSVHVTPEIGHLKTGSEELFTVAYNQFLHNPAWLQENAPEQYAWFRQALGKLPKQAEHVVPAEPGFAHNVVPTQADLAQWAQKFGYDLDQDLGLYGPSVDVDALLAKVWAEYGANPHSIEPYVAELQTFLKNWKAGLVAPAKPAVVSAESPVLAFAKGGGLATPGKTETEAKVAWAQAYAAGKAQGWSDGEMAAQYHAGIVAAGKFQPGTAEEWKSEYWPKMLQIAKDGAGEPAVETIHGATSGPGGLLELLEKQWGELPGGSKFMPGQFAEVWKAYAEGTKWQGADVAGSPLAKFFKAETGHDFGFAMELGGKPDVDALWPKFQQDYPNTAAGMTKGQFEELVHDSLAGGDPNEIISKPWLTEQGLDVPHPELVADPAQPAPYAPHPDHKPWTGDKYALKFANGHKEWLGDFKAAFPKDLVEKLTADVEWPPSTVKQGPSVVYWYQLRKAMARTYNLALEGKWTELGQLDPKLEAFWKERLAKPLPEAPTAAAAAPKAPDATGPPLKESGQVKEILKAHGISGLTPQQFSDLQSIYDSVAKGAALDPGLSKFAPSWKAWFETHPAGGGLIVKPYQTDLAHLRKVKDELRVDAATKDWYVEFRGQFGYNMIPKLTPEWTITPSPAALGLPAGTAADATKREVRVLGFAKSYLMAQAGDVEGLKRISPDLLEFWRARIPELQLPALPVDLTRPAPWTQLIDAGATGGRNPRDSAPFVRRVRASLAGNPDAERRFNLMRGAVGEWKGNPQRIHADSESVMVYGKDPTTERHLAALTFWETIRNADRSNVPVLRRWINHHGEKATAGYWRQVMAKGEAVDMNLSGFSDPTGRFGQMNVRYVIPAGTAPAIPLGAIADGFVNESEWVAGGRFRVVRVEELSGYVQLTLQYVSPDRLTSTVLAERRKIGP